MVQSSFSAHAGALGSISQCNWLEHLKMKTVTLICMGSLLVEFQEKCVCSASTELLAA